MLLVLDELELTGVLLAHYVGAQGQELLSLLLIDKHLLVDPEVLVVKNPLLGQEANVIAEALLVLALERVSEGVLVTHH